MKRRILTFMVLLGLSVAGLANALVGAIFTDQAQVDQNDFTTGTVDIAVSPASALISYANMAPGDVVIGDLTVQNSGSLELRYAMTASATDPDGKHLKDQLQLKIKPRSAASCSAEDYSNGLIYSGPIGAAAFGDPAQGAQSGDRTLAAGASEHLCFRAELPISTDNSYQGAQTSVVFTFAAEQTKNNP